MSQTDLTELVARRLREPKDEPWHATKDLFDSPSVRQFTANTVIKWTHSKIENGTYMMSHVQKHTSIPIPTIHRHWRCPVSRRAYIAMDYIRGDTLETAWPSLSPEQQLWIGQTLRGYVEQLRAVPPPPGWSGAPGPFEQSNQPMPCPPMWIFSEDGAGPFNSYADMTRWFDIRRTRLLLHFYQHLKPSEELPDIDMFDNAEPLVMSHGDLNMRNILLERDPISGQYLNKVWLIDWDFAGFYPPAFEYSFMLGVQGLPQSWVNYVPLVAGPYQRQYEYFEFLNHGFLALVRFRGPPDTDSVDDEEARAKIIGWR